MFVAFAWLPKATVQAAIGPLALDKAKEALASSGFNCSQQLLSDLRSNNETMENINPLSPSENGDIGDMVELCKMVEYGEKVLTIAVLVILITAPIGAIAIMTSGPKLLSQTEEQKVNAGTDA